MENGDIVLIYTNYSHQDSHEVNRFVSLLFIQAFQEAVFRQHPKSKKESLLYVDSDISLWQNEGLLNLLEQGRDYDVTCHFSLLSQKLLDEDKTFKEALNRNIRNKIFCSFSSVSDVESCSAFLNKEMDKNMFDSTIFRLKNTEAIYCLLDKGIEQKTIIGENLIFTSKE